MTQTWLSEPDDEDIADQFATASEGFEALSRDMSDIFAALESTAEAGAYEREHIDRLESLYELLDDYREDVAERQRKHSPDPKPHPDRERLEASWERDQPPAGYDPAPMPTLALDIEMMTMAFTPHPLRTIKCPRHGTASNYLQRVVSAENGRFTMGSFDMLAFNEEFATDVEPGDLFCVGYKRHERDRAREFHIVGVGGVEQIDESEVKRCLREQGDDS